jgi:phosphofructokinase-like protein
MPPAAPSAPPNVRRIGLLTGGGDCPGLNAVIRAVVYTAEQHGIEVHGIRDGYLGLIEDRVAPISEPDVRDILMRGGTVLGTSNKANPAKFAVGTKADGTPDFQDVTDRCLATIARHKLDALVLVGGDGTMAGSKAFLDAGVNCIGVPKTIDNDLEGTDMTFGFMTAVDIAAEALDRVRTTAASHQRIITVEVMGRNAGWISLFSGVAGGADAVLLPEIPFSFDSLARMVSERRARGQMSTVIAVAEGAHEKGGALTVKRTDLTSPDPVRLGGIAQRVADRLEELTKVESRYVVLGHVQRGGTPAAADRILGTQFGHAAINLLLAGKRNRLVGRRSFIETDVDILEVVGKIRRVPLDHPVLLAARNTGVRFGDE